jgi:hypothetical protein
MLSKLLNLFKRHNPVNPQITDSVTQAPYKVEAPKVEATPAQAMEAAVKEKIAKPAAKRTSKPRVKKQ